MSISTNHVRWNSSCRTIIHTLLASTLALTSLPALAQEIIPPERKITWQAGIDGGIPTVPVETNVLDFGAVADGLTDDAQAFKNAIAALPPQGGAVLIPAGTYLLRSTIELDDDTVLRGQGATNTFLQFDLGGSNNNAIEAITYERGTWVDIQGGHDKDSTTLTVANASEFVVPTFAEIQQTNDPDIMYTHPNWDKDWAEDSVGEIVRIIGKSGNQLTLADPLHFSYDPNMDPLIRPQGFVERAGVEYLHIERLDDGGGGHLILFQSAAWSWVRAVESAMSNQSHFYARTVYGCEVRDSYIHDAHEYFAYGGAGYGINLLLHTTNCLVENNIFVNLRHSMMVQMGANGNVFGYNYSRDPIEDQWTAYTDISLHGHFPFYNLFEGNIAQEPAVSDHWGPSGPGNTFLRNCVQSEGLWIEDHSHDQNVIGNTLTDGAENDIIIDASVEGTLKHGNWVNGGLQWASGIPNRTIPDSYYLAARPPFYGTDDWPSIGGDLGPACTNPASKRWDNHQETPGSPGDGAPPDTTPPTPSQMNWQSPPTAMGTSSVSMTAVTATDASGGVEYNFTCVSGGPGCSISGWQTSPTFTDDGLQANTAYTYRVRAKDAAGNMNVASVTTSVTTDDVAGTDTSPPSPSQMSWQSPPTAMGTSSVSMTAVTATDASGGVEYNFTCVSGGPGCSDSNWQPSPTFTDDGLQANTTYTYRVRARDAAGNMNVASVTTSVTTDDVADTTPPPGANQSPTAVASYSPNPAQIAKGNTVRVKFNGTSSSDPDGSITAWSWKNQSGSVVGTTATFSVKLPNGNHSYTLTVTDNMGASDATEITVNVIGKVKNRKRKRGDRIIGIKGG